MIGKLRHMRPRMVLFSSMAPSLPTTMTAMHRWSCQDLLYMEFGCATERRAFDVRPEDHAIYPFDLLDLLDLLYA